LTHANLVNLNVKIQPVLLTFFCVGNKLVIDNLRKNAQKSNKSTLTSFSGQTVQPINPSWNIFRKLISLAIHWHIKLYQK